MQALKAKNALIDEGIDSLTRTIDNLGNISSAMKDEVCVVLDCIVVGVCDTVMFLSYLWHELINFGLFV